MGLHPVAIGPPNGHPVAEGKAEDVEAGGGEEGGSVV